MEWLRVLLNIIFPPRQEALLVASLDHDGVRALVHVQRSPKGWSLVSYDDPRVRALVWEAKYHRNHHALILIGTALSEALAEHIGTTTHCVPIPLSTRRLHERGYNQVTEALKASIRKPLPHILEDALLRTRDTVPQTQLSRKQRLTNVVGCFAVASEVRTQIHGAHIVIIDDVITTGATLAEARLTLLRAGASRVDVLAFARS